MMSKDCHGLDAPEGGFVGDGWAHKREPLFGDGTERATAKGVTRVSEEIGERMESLKVGDKVVHRSEDFRHYWVGCYIRRIEGEEAIVEQEWINRRGGTVTAAYLLADLVRDDNE